MLQPAMRSGTLSAFQLFELARRRMRDLRWVDTSANRIEGTNAPITRLHANSSGFAIDSSRSHRPLLVLPRSGHPFRHGTLARKRGAGTHARGHVRRPERRD